MAAHSLLSPLEIALSQSQALMSLANAGDWASFETLVQQRQQGLLSINDPDYLESLTEADLDVKASIIIKAIKAINEELSVLAQQNRDYVATELRQVTQAGKAIEAYRR